MKMHANAPLGPKGRALMVARVVDEGSTIKQGAEAAGVSERSSVHARGVRPGPRAVCGD